MTVQLKERHWRNLIRRIQTKKCTPFIGAGACAGTLPIGSDIAREWADQHRYPLADTRDLSRVAQYLAVNEDDMFPKEDIQQRIEGVASPDFSQLDEPHGLLADLDLPLYITTNYDDFMSRALESRNRDPKQQVCLWNNYPELEHEQALDSGYRPSIASPLVYHLHGSTAIPQSMVLTEDDYLDFLVRLSGDRRLLPPAITTALAGTSLLFIGYSLNDLSFRVLFRGLMSSLGANLQYSSVAVQLPPSDVADGSQERAQAYLGRYLRKVQKMKVNVFWGDARAFASELRERLESADDART